MAGTTNALQKPVQLSGELEAVIGKGPMTRAEVTSKVWEYIKANGLQDSKDKRQINPDAPGPEWRERWPERVFCGPWRAERPTIRATRARPTRATPLPAKRRYNKIA